MSEQPEARPPLPSFSTTPPKTVKVDEAEELALIERRMTLERSLTQGEAELGQYLVELWSPGAEVKIITRSGRHGLLDMGERKALDIRTRHPAGDEGHWMEQRLQITTIEALRALFTRWRGRELGWDPLPPKPARGYLSSVKEVRE